MPSGTAVEYDSITLVTMSSGTAGKCDSQSVMQWSPHVHVLRLRLVAGSASLVSCGRAANKTDLGQGCQSAYIMAEQNSWKVLSEDLNRLIG